MNKSEFDQYADDYAELHRRSIAFSGCELDYFAEYKAKYAAACFHEHCSKGEVLLDFGCGTGSSIPFFTNYLDNPALTCADVSDKSLEIAKRRFGGLAIYSHINGPNLDLESGSVAMVFSSCVFHHIILEQQPAWFMELRRVTRPQGVALIFEHNPINPLTRRAVAECAFDKDAILLKAATLSSRLRASGWTPLAVRYHVFFPGFLRRLRPVETWLGWLPLGGQYSVLSVKR